MTDKSKDGGPATEHTVAAQAELPDWEFHWDADPHPHEFGPSHWARWHMDEYAIGEVGYCEYKALRAGSFLRDEFGEALIWRSAKAAAQYIAILKARGTQ